MHEASVKGNPTCGLSPPRSEGHLSNKTAPSDRHPRGLGVLLAVEFLERFRFCLVVFLLATYLTESRGYTEAAAAGTYGVFIALTYGASLIGGVVGDRLLGHRLAVAMGTGLLTLGYLMLAWARAPLLASMAVLILASGLFKPNLLALLGQLYEDDDPRREAGFSYFYTAINLGAFCGPLLGEAMRIRFGWAALFALAGAALLCANLALAAGWRLLDGTRRCPRRLHTFHGTGERSRIHDGEGSAVLTVLLLSLLLIPFWAAYFQNGSTLVYWARHNVRRDIGGFLIPPAWFASLSALVTIALGPPLPRVWTWLRRRCLEPAMGTKLFWGLLLTSGAYVLIALGGLWGGDKGRICLSWLVVASCMLALGEQLVSPAGLSLVSRLAPPRLAARLSSLWLLSICAGAWVAGGIGTLWQRCRHSLFFGGIALGVLVSACVLWRHRARWTAPTVAPPTGPHSPAASSHQSMSGSL